jgi:hypothetical protein
MIFCDVGVPGFPSTLGLVTSPAFAITFGQPATFTVGMIAYAIFKNIYTDPNVSFTTDFSHTMNLVGFVVLDANGAPLNSFNVTSESGTVYPDTTAPEPSCLFLLGGGISLLVARYKSHHVS